MRLIDMHVSRNSAMTCTQEYWGVLWMCTAPCMHLTPQAVAQYQISNIQRHLNTQSCKIQPTELPDHKQCCRKNHKQTMRKTQDRNLRVAHHLIQYEEPIMPLSSALSSPVQNLNLNHTNK